MMSSDTSKGRGQLRTELHILPPLPTRESMRRILRRGLTMLELPFRQFTVIGGELKEEENKGRKAS